jgi:hypothetical protein
MPKQRERYPMSKLSTQQQSNSAEESKQNLGHQVANLFLILAVIVALLGFLIDWKNTMSSGAVDFRNRVVAARLLIRGIDPYYFKWHPGISDLFLDPIVDPSWPVSRATIPPTVVVLHAAMAKLPYLTQKIVWFALQWGLFLSTLTVLTKVDKISPLKSKFILILGLLFFSGSFFWRFHVERGQIYILYVFLLSCAYWLARNSARKDHLLSGFLVGLTASLRPPLFLMSVPMVVYRQWVLLIGTAVGLLSGLLFSFLLADVGTWNSYFSAMKIYQKAHLGLLEVKTIVNADNVNTESPVPIEGLTNLTKALDFPASDTSFPSIFKHYFGLNLSANILMLFLGITLLAICFYLDRNRPGARGSGLVFLSGISIVLLAEHFLPTIRATYNNVQYILPFSIIVVEINLVEFFQNKASLLLLIGLLFNLGFSWIPDSVLIGDLTMLLYALIMSLSIAKNC